MLFSVSHHSKNKNQAGEIRCPYNQLGTILDFIKKNPNKRYVVSIPDDTTKVQIERGIKQIELLKDMAPNYTVQCSNVHQLRDLLNEGYNAFLKYSITDWELFAEMRDLKVSDIYIDGPLGFQMSAIKKGKGDIKIRVSPTVSPNAALVNRDICSFYIRPEDLKQYSDAIDIIDFKAPNQDVEDTLFSVYTRGTFSYDIADLINGLPQGLNNLIFKDEFASCRLNCGQKCKIPGHSCHYCDNYFTIIQQMHDLAKRQD